MGKTLSWESGGLRSGGRNDGVESVKITQEE